MEGFEKQVAMRLPLGETVFRLLDFVCQKEFLDGVFERHRGRSYEGEISFPLFVQLIADALLEHDGSGRKSFLSDWPSATNVRSRTLENLRRRRIGQLVRPPFRNSNSR